MIALAVLPVFAVLVAAPTGPEDGCPSARQVTDAMQARFPEFLVQASQTSGSAMSDILHAVLDVAPDGTVVRFSLVDSRGEIQLRRALPASGRGTSPADCVALADTVAAIVERFLAAIAYEGTETDPWNARGQLRKPPDATGVDATHRGLTGSGRFLAVLGGGWRLTAGGEAGQGQVGQSGPEARLGVQSHLTRSLPRLAAVASVGIGRAIEFDLPDGSPRATLRRFPIRIGGLWTMPAGPGWLEPA